jgi:hypothetical protein
MAFVDKLQNRLNHVQNFVDCEPALTITQEIESNVFEFDLSKEINAEEIVALIYKHREQFPESNVTNVNAWHSGYRTHKQTTVFDSLIKVIEQRVDLVMRSDNDRILKDFKMYPKVVDSWAIIYEKNDHTKWHNHTPANYSVVYYARADADTAPLVFKKTKEHSIEIKPRTNMLVVFQGYANHMVPKLDNENQRICFSANLHLIGREN